MAAPTVIEGLEDATFTLATGTLAVVVPDGARFEMRELRAMASHLAVDTALGLDEAEAGRVHRWLAARWGVDS